MKFDYCIGNPPYQIEAPGTSTSDKPVYNYFMDAAFEIANVVELITPGRFLFKAGATPIEWNVKMLSDPHFKVLDYEVKSNKIFENTDITGGIAISYRDTNQDFGSIGIFTPFSELRTLLKKVEPHLEITGALDTIIFTQNKFNLEILNKDIPDLNRTDRRLESNIFKLSVFNNERTNDDDFLVIGLVKNKRVKRYVNRKYIDHQHENLFKYKVILPKSNGSGSFGEVEQTQVIGNPVVIDPNTAYTRTFIGVGSFSSVREANAALKYLKSKFCRTMLGILKVTQDNNPEKWKLVPLQDFTSGSDIDWSVTVTEIDRQLYEKYGLDADEIAFIEENVKEMK